MSIRHWIVRATSAIFRVDTLEASEPDDPEDYIDQYEAHPDTEIGAYISSVDDIQEVTDGVFAVSAEPDSISSLMEEIGINSVEVVDPIEGIEAIEDDPGMCYVWKLKNSSTEFRNRLSDKITDVYRGEPDALHFFVEDVKEIKQWDYQTIEHDVIPWLANAKTLNEEELTE